jgi:hypothetical protein
LARAECARLLGDGQSLAAPWLATALRAAGLPELPVLGTIPRIAEAPLPQPRVLPRGRAVRIVYGERTGVGHVVDARSGEATVKLPNQNGFQFPTVPVVAVEPIDASADEAIEMAFAALQQGDRLLARLWRLRAVTATTPAAAERLRTLQSVLD